MNLKLLWKIVGAGLLMVFVLWLLAIAVGFISWPFHAISNVQETGHGIIDKTINADNAIYNYEWFKRQYENYLAIKAKIGETEAALESFKIEAGPRSQWKFYDTAEFNRLNSVLLGLRQTLNDLVAEYNARSKMVNRSIFKTGDLPVTLP
ncbi:MAG: hypothetical protein PHD96_02150, partial [Candidatus Pacebacteria bacterium]|nr:hypothetical protein [Candidatus Paceibacterota bacterium]